jgi:hypothetical protein
MWTDRREADDIHIALQTVVTAKMQSFRWDRMLTRTLGAQPSRTEGRIAKSNAHWKQRFGLFWLTNCRSRDSVGNV